MSKLAVAKPTVSQYTPEEYEALDIGDYRHRFPTETKRFTDERLFDLVAATEDDMEDDEWRKYFTDAI